MPLTTALRKVLQRRRAERELDDELAFHVEMETQANIGRGMTPEDGRLAALRAFGGIVQAREQVRDVRTLGVEAIWLGLRQAVRALAAQRRFTLTASAMLAIAIGIVTAMFTVIDALIVRPVPFRNPGALAHLWMGDDHGGRVLVAPAVLKAWQESPAFDAAESAWSETALLEAGGTIVTREVAVVTPGIFQMLGGVTPLHGRLFVTGEGRAGESDRVLVSETLWRALYNADPAFVGSSMTVDGERMTVVGILPAEFRFPAADAVVWRPTALQGAGELAKVYVRFADGVPREDALRLAADAARAADPRNANLRPWVYPLAGVEDAYSSRALPLLTGGVVLVFLVLCANVCSLLLARVTSRRREFGMRAAIGASRRRLLGEALAESAVLGALGVAAGVGIAAALVSVARALIPEPLLMQTLNPITLDARALAVTSVAGLAATAAAGLLPAWLGTRVDTGDALRAADRSGTDSRGARAVTRGLLVVEVALACTLLVGAALLTRSFVNLTRADRGLNTAGVTTLWLALPAAAADATARGTLVRAIEDTLRSLPSVQHVAWSYGLPPRGGLLSHGEFVADVPGAQPVELELARYVVSPEFFPLYGIEIIRGRGFEAADGFEAVIVSERLAGTLWPGLDPVGRTFTFEKDQFHVVGLAREIHYPTVDARRDGPEFYHPYTTAGTPMASLRCVPDCPDAAFIRSRLATAHPAVSVQDASPLERAYQTQLVTPRAAAALAIAFGTIALVAAAGGLFSVLSYAVSRRRREFGVRAALGASRRQISRTVIGDALAVTAAGLFAGSVLGAMLTRGLASLQYGVTATDPVSWLLVLGVIVVTAALATWAPARAAATIDPLVLLRQE